jgi:hypothetical protein
MLRLERTFNILIELLIGASSLSGVQVAATSDATIGGTKIERRRYDVEVSEG